MRSRSSGSLTTCHFQLVVVAAYLDRWPADSQAGLFAKACFDCLGVIRQALMARKLLYVGQRRAE